MLLQYLLAVQNRLSELIPLYVKIAQAMDSLRRVRTVRILVNNLLKDAVRIGIFAEFGITLSEHQPDVVALALPKFGFKQCVIRLHGFRVAAFVEMFVRRFNCV